mmetsp:Transcript_42952/g.47798  ORF Transcript_42952/g.47798 Transcript_42952/m.47798 type:complete len:227 (+) Transcript_42952:1317-1997(+)
MSRLDRSIDYSKEVKKKKMVVSKSKELIHYIGSKRNRYRRIIKLPTPHRSYSFALLSSSFCRCISFSRSSSSSSLSRRFELFLFSIFSFSSLLRRHLVNEMYVLISIPSNCHKHRASWKEARYAFSSCWINSNRRAQIAKVFDGFRLNNFLLIPSLSVCCSFILLQYSCIFIFKKAISFEISMRYATGFGLDHFVIFRVIKIALVGGMMETMIFIRMSRLRYWRWQ